MGAGLLGVSSGVNKSIRSPKYLCVGGGVGGEGEG